MRVLLGWLLLFGLAAFAGWGTARWRARARAMGDSVTRVQDAEVFGAPARVLIGAPSGAEPLGRERTPVRTPPHEITSIAPDPSDPLSPQLPAPFELEVQPGNVLSTICQDFYVDEDRPSLVEVVRRVAAWNGLSSPDDLKAGQIIQLPSIEQLFP